MRLMNLWKGVFLVIWVYISEADSEDFPVIRPDSDQKKKHYDARTELVEADVISGYWYDSELTFACSIGQFLSKRKSLKKLPRLQLYELNAQTNT